MAAIWPCFCYIRGYEIISSIEKGDDQMEQPLISFIIPVYNGERCIEKAAHSVLEMQSIPFELLLIDDGSTDQTPAICDRLAIKDRRVHVFHTENQGQGKARNLGIHSSTGKYLMFVDADDTVVWPGVLSLLQRAEQGRYDVVSGLYYRKNGEQEELINSRATSGAISRDGEPDAVKRYHQIKTASLFGYLWNKLYRKSFLEKHELLLDDIKTVYMEDTLFNLKVWSKQPSYYFLAVPVYRYDVTNESTTRKAEPDIAQKNACMISNYVAFLDSQNLFFENLDLLVPLAMRVFCWSLVKNIPFEGFSRQKILEKEAVFLEADSFHRILYTRGSRRLLRFLPSFPERLFYRFCFFLLKHRLKKFLSLVFSLLYPGMRFYIRQTVK